MKFNYWTALFNVAGSCLVALLLAHAAHAADPITINNFNFEDSFTGTNTGTIPSWNEPTPSGSIGTFQFTTEIVPGQSSNSAGGDVASAFFNTNLSINQTTGHAIASGDLYTLLVDVGDRVDNVGGVYDISLYKDTIANVLATTTINTGTVFPNLSDTGWVENVELQYTALVADAGSQLGVLITKTGGGIGAVDNVRLDVQVQQVPEPSSICAWLLAGLVALAFGRRYYGRTR